MPIIDENGHFLGYRGTAKDITQRKEMVEHLSQLNDRLRRSNKELEEFAYIASHDMQEPLRKIHGYLDLLRERYHDRLDGDANEFIDYAVDGSRRMRDMINGLLTYSRLTAQAKPLDMVATDKMVHNVVADLQLAIEDSGATVEVQENLPEVKADPNQLGQLFSNLLRNSIRQEFSR